jgi:hypothetical protein
MVIFGAVAALLLGSSPAWAQPDGLQRFAGEWSCSGHFVANRRPISSHIKATFDASTNSLIVRHDDDPPNAYQALEVWSPSRSGDMRASISDAFSGMRWFSSAGWVGQKLTWERRSDGAPVERFDYAFDANGTLSIEWSTARPDGTFAIGDTLTCRKT